MEEEEGIIERESFFVLGGSNPNAEIREVIRKLYSKSPTVRAKGLSDIKKVADQLTSPQRRLFARQLSVVKEALNGIAPGYDRVLDMTVKVLNAGGTLLRSIRPQDAAATIAQGTTMWSAARDVYRQLRNAFTSNN